MKISIISLILLAFSSLFVEQTFAQNEHDHNGPHLVEVNGLKYPAIAAAARVQGTVHIQLIISRDAKLLKSDPIDGPAMLQDASSNILTHFIFDCSKCTAEQYPLLITLQFTLDIPTNCDQPSTDTKYEIKENSVIIHSGAIILCDPSPDIIKSRSLKCLYLWRCSTVR
jgi:hypothetical protein